MPLGQSHYGEAHPHVGHNRYGSALMAGERVTLKRLREHKQALEEFRTEYQKFLSPAWEAHRAELRARVNDLIPAADDALQDLGLGIAAQAAPMTGSNLTLSGLSNVAFAFERPGFRTLPGEPSLDEHVLDVVGQAIGDIREREKAIKRLHRRPLYWGDRGLRALLGFPAYLVSIILGVPKHKVEASPFAPVLRIIAVAADILGIFVAGKVLKWW